MIELKLWLAVAITDSHVKLIGLFDDKWEMFDAKDDYETKNPDAFTDYFQVSAGEKCDLTLFELGDEQ